MHDKRYYREVDWSCCYYKHLQFKARDTKGRGDKYLRLLDRGWHDSCYCKAGAKVGAYMIGGRGTSLDEMDK